MKQKRVNIRGKHYINWLILIGFIGILYLFVRLGNYFGLRLESNTQVPKPQQQQSNPVDDWEIVDTMKVNGHTWKIALGVPDSNTREFYLIQGDSNVRHSSRVIYNSDQIYFLKKSNSVVFLEYFDNGFDPDLIVERLVVYSLDKNQMTYMIDRNKLFEYIPNKALRESMKFDVLRNLELSPDERFIAFNASNIDEPSFTNPIFIVDLENRRVLLGPNGEVEGWLDNNSLEYSIAYKCELERGCITQKTYTF